MRQELTEPALADRLDRRVRRSRAALFAAAVRLVSERGTTAVPVTDLAEAADVSRQVVYLHFADRDALFVAAALDLLDRELTQPVGAAPVPADLGSLALAAHFAAHRPFYRAMLTGSCSFAMTRAFNGRFGAVNRGSVRGLFAGSGELDEAVLGDLAAFVAGGTAAVVNEWLIEGADPLDPRELADRLLRLRSVLTEGRAR